MFREAMAPPGIGVRQFKFGHTAHQRGRVVEGLLSPPRIQSVEVTGILHNKPSWFVAAFSPGFAQAYGLFTSK